MHPRLLSLSRTSSRTSISSSEDSATANARAANNVRRTRKRFTSAQLAVLEAAFHVNSHPSREERAQLAAALDATETKSVTIWFQNKRQTERRVISSSCINKTTTIMGNRGRTASSSSSCSSCPRPSLDSVASRFELRAPAPASRTLPIWANMPSSPIAPPATTTTSPSTRSRSKRTLEWACAAARHADKQARRQRKETTAVVVKRASSESTEEDAPPTADVRWNCYDDQDMMKAALMLCGLGRQ